jgi:SH3-like domain-containing protein
MAIQTKVIGQWAVAGSLLLAASGALAQSQQKTPYWASIEEPEARMRTGPSTEFPVKWVYKRQNLPVKVVAVHSVWRKVEDPDGDQGWMHVRLLSPKRTAVVTGSGTGSLRESPQETARIAWRVEAGVVGRIDECEKGWCRFENAGRFGYIESDRLWGEEAP